MTNYYLRTNNFLDIWKASVLEHSFDIFPIFQKTSKSEHLCFFIIVLKFEEPQFHAFNINNVRIILSYFALDGFSELVELEINSCPAYKDLVKKRELTCYKARYFGK